MQLPKDINLSIEHRPLRPGEPLPVHISFLDQHGVERDLIAYRATIGPRDIDANGSPVPEAIEHDFEGDG